MKKLILLYLVVCIAHGASAQQGLQAYVVTGTGAQARIVLTGSAIVLHQLTWNVTGTVSSCTVALDTSADGVSWSAGNAIAGQTCTSNGQSALSSSAVFNFVRVNTTAFSGTGSVVITWAGYVATPGGLPSGCTSPGTGQINCTNAFSTGSGASAAGATATGGFACVEGASTGWTPTVGQDYQRCDNTLHNFVCSLNGAAEGACSTPGVVLVPGTTAANRIAPTADVVGVTVLGTTAGAPVSDIIEVCLPSAGVCGTKELWVTPSGLTEANNFISLGLINVDQNSSGGSMLNFGSASDHITQAVATNDISGTIAVSASTTGSKTFGTAYTSAPRCVITPQTDPTTVGVWWVTTSTTAVTANVKVSGTINFSYICMGAPN